MPYICPDCGFSERQCRCDDSVCWICHCDPCNCDEMWMDHLAGEHQPNCPWCNFDDGEHEAARIFLDPPEGPPY